MLQTANNFVQGNGLDRDCWLELLQPGARHVWAMIRLPNIVETGIPSLALLASGVHYFNHRDIGIKNISCSPAHYFKIITEIVNCMK